MKTLLSIAAAVGLLAGLILSGGCETEALTGRINVTPSEVTISYGQSVTFTASGGYEYRWSLQNEDWGVLSSRTGSSVTYTSLYRPATNDVETQVLTVTGTFAGSAGSSTGSVSTATGEAYIKHR